MKLITNNKTYAVTSFRPSSDGCVVTAVEPVDVGAELRIETDEGAELRTYTVADWLRCVADGCTVRLTNTPEPAPVPVDVEAVRAAKLAEISTAQGTAITAGVDVTTQTVGAEHFALTLADQTNINDMFYGGVLLGADGYLYHADADDCRYYPAADITAIYAAKQEHITYHTTYGNLLRKWARRCGTADELAGVAYGQQLPEDLAAEFAALLEQAKAEMETVLTKITGGAQNA